MSDKEGEKKKKRRRAPAVVVILRGEEGGEMKKTQRIENSCSKEREQR